MQKCHKSHDLHLYVQTYTNFTIVHLGVLFFPFSSSLARMKRSFNMMDVPSMDISIGHHQLIAKLQDCVEHHLHSAKKHECSINDWSSDGTDGSIESVNTPDKMCETILHNLLRGTSDLLNEALQKLESKWEAKLQSSQEEWKAKLQSSQAKVQALEEQT